MVEVAFIGLGAMGLPMARRVAGGEGVALTLFDVRPDFLPLAAALGRPAASVEDAVEAADVVLSVLPADPQAIEVAAAVARVGRHEQIYVDFSTISPETMANVARDLAEVGVLAVSATCMKGVAAARGGELSLFLGGSSQVVERLCPILGRIATEHRYVGDHAAAKTLKLVNNLIVSTLDLLLCEALLVGARLGISAEHAVAEFRAGGADSWALQNHVVKHALSGDFAPGNFSIKYMAKDVRLAVKVGQSVGRSTFFGGAVLSAYRGVTAHGYANHYHPVVLRWLEAGARSGDITAVTGDDDSQLVEPLVLGLVALQALVTLEALRVAEGVGLVPITAAGHLLEGSARNPFLDELVCGGLGGARLSLRVILQHVEQACELAHEASVPAMSFELGRHLALVMIDLWGEAACPANLLGLERARPA